MRLRICGWQYLIPSLATMLSLLTGAAMAGGPAIRLSEETFDFGYTPAGLEATHRYWVVNTGDEELHIQRVRPTCGCTTVPLPRDRVAPGDSVELDLVFNTQKFTGNVWKAVRLFSNEVIPGDTAKAKERKIYFRAQVAEQDESISITPQSAFLDTLGKHEQILTLRNTDDVPYTISVSSPPPSYLALELPSGKQLPPDQEVQIILRTGADTPIGTYKGSMTLRLEGPRVVSLTVPIYGMGYYE